MRFRTAQFVVRLVDLTLDHAVSIGKSTGDKEQGQSNWKQQFHNPDRIATVNRLPGRAGRVGHRLGSRAPTGRGDRHPFRRRSGHDPGSPGNNRRFCSIDGIVARAIASVSPAIAATLIGGFTAKEHSV